MNNIKNYESFSDINILERIKNNFPELNLQDGGLVGTYYKNDVPSLIIRDVEEAVTILKYLESLLYPYSIGGNPRDIEEVYDRLGGNRVDVTVKLAIPLFKDERYKQKIYFIFDNNKENPPMMEYDSLSTESPSLIKRVSYVNFKGYGRYDYDKFFKLFNY